MPEKIYYVVMKVCLWKDCKLEQRGDLKLPYPLSLVQEGAEIGYLPVYTTMEAAKEAAGSNANVFIIQEIKEGENG